MSATGAPCAGCLRRAHALGVLAGHLDTGRAHIDELLALGTDELLGALAGRRRARLEGLLDSFDAKQALEKIDRAHLKAICECDPRYPARLRQLPAPPAVLHIAGDLNGLLAAASTDSVAIVGSRRASSYGLEVARSLGRALSAVGVPVLAGMAVGIDTAAHEGAVAAGGPTIAILPAGAERVYPASARALHRRIVSTGAVVGELPPGTSVRRWMFPARNRLIAALSAMTIVVEAADGSGALLTASIARDLGRRVGAVPGRITSPHASGCHSLIAGGAELIGGPEQVLEALFGGSRPPAVVDPRPEPDGLPRTLLRALRAGDDIAAAFAATGTAQPDGFAALAWLELAGYVRRGAGGRYTVIA